MKIVSIGLVLGSAIVLMTGCASTSLKAPEHEDVKAKQFATEKGKSNIYVYRNEFYGAAVSMPVTLDGKNIGNTGANTYIKVSAEPGNHTLVSKAENDATLNLITQENKNYFVWQEVKMGIMSARSKLKLVSEEEGKKGVNECKLLSMEEVKK